MSLATVEIFLKLVAISTAKPRPKPIFKLLGLVLGLVIGLALARGQSGGAPKFGHTC